MKETKLVFLTIFALFFLFSACKFQKEPEVGGRNYQGIFLSMPYEIDVVGDTSNLQSQIDSVLEPFELIFNLNNPKSVCSRLNNFDRTDSAFVFKDSTLIFGIVFDLMKDMHTRSNNLYDPTLTPLKLEWMKAMMTGIQGVEPNLDSLYEFVGYDGAKIDLLEVYDETGKYSHSVIRKKTGSVNLDLTNLARAYALDALSDYLNDLEVEQFKIHSGNNTICYGTLVPELNLVNLGIGEEGDQQQIKLVNRAFSFKDSKDKQGMLDVSYGYPVSNEMVYVGVSARKLFEAEVFSETFMIMGIEPSYQWYEYNSESDVQSFMLFMKDSDISYASTEGFVQFMVQQDSLTVK
ncbi:MAG: FAD:protein FMN transferase [Flavobacteriales bacterium]